MLSAQHINTVKSTVPLLESAGTAITEHFYQRMFSHNPELKDIFNLSHQHSGGQSAALFNAILAYAKHIDNLAALGSAVERIAHKHTSFHIQPEHYPIVGHHLIETLRELAPDAFTAEVEEAWTAAYGLLANVFIDKEASLYHASSHKTGGWQGPRGFIISDKVIESELVTSFILSPEDGLAVADYLPGQYIGIKVAPDGHPHQEIRQYSLSDKANGTHYRISVKRESANAAATGESAVDGVVSNYLHHSVNVGDRVELFAPAGDFHYQDNDKPVVLISAGVGITPMQAMLETLASNKHQHGITYLHACENAAQLSFQSRVAQLSEALPLRCHLWLNQQQTSDSIKGTEVHQGLMQLAPIAEQLPLNDGDFYLCGPVAFMRAVQQQLLALGVQSDAIHYEVFGPHATL